MTTTLPPKPADSGFPTQEGEIRERLKNAPDIVLEATLDREIQVEKILRSKLDFAQLKIRLAQEEQSRRIVNRLSNDAQELGIY